MTRHPFGGRVLALMRLQLLSDVHTEFHADGGSSFVQSLDASGVDVLVLAGDIAVGAGIAEALALFCEHYANSTVVYVHGNHEHYGCERDQVVGLTRAATQSHANLIWLDADVASVHGRRFVGGPLWFRRTEAAQRYRRSIADFSEIPQFESWVYRENERMLALLEQELRAGDIVVTHHLPSYRSVAARFSGSPLNVYFVCDVEDLIEARQPALWMHGHTHASVDAKMGATRVLCNPFGYVRWELNSSFKPRSLIEI